MPKTASVLVYLLATAATPYAASAQTPPVPAVDPVARAMAQEALAAATAPVVVKTTVVGGQSLRTPPVTDGVGTIGNSPIQVNGSEPDNTGYLAFKYGADAKGIVNYWVKTRGTTPNSYGAVQLGDRIVLDAWQAGTGGQTGHAGLIQVTVDKAAFTAGEVAGRWSLLTGTGIHSSQASKQYPNRFGSMDALVANSYQQVLFPGGATDTTPGAGANFGGWVVIGAGASSPGFGALKFLSPGAALLATPEAGAFEVDAGATPYFTRGDGVRRAVVLADVAAPAVATKVDAGSGATTRIDASGSSGVVTLTAGTNAGGGDLFTVTYAHAYSTASYPVVSAANPAAAALVRSSYLTATAAGFTLSLPAGATVAAGTDYAVTFYAPGR